MSAAAAAPKAVAARPAAPPAAQAPAASRARVPGKRVAVAPFDAPSESQARVAVLTTLSDHTDIEVIAHEDIVMAGKRLKADPAQPEGRRKLSEELGVDGWIDGKIEADSARVTLQGPDGRTLATASLNGQRSSMIDGLIGERVWAAMGVWLSPLEQQRRALEAQRELAVKKALAREQELVRQRALVQTRAQARRDQLKAAQALARQKRSAFEAELKRQHEAAEERIALAKREKNQAEQQLREQERQREQAEEAEFMASLQESSGPSAQTPTTPAPATNATNQWLAAAAAQPAAQAGTRAPETRSGSTSAPARVAPGSSPWVYAQQGGGYTPPASAPSYAPAHAPAYAAPAPASGGYPAGLSPATRRWLEEQRAQMR